VAKCLNTQLDEDIPSLGQTNEEVRQNIRVNLWSMALKLRLEITKYDKNNKFQLFLVSLIVTSSIIVLTYLNALLQHILKTGKTVNYLVIVSTIIGFNYKKSYVEDEKVVYTCLGIQLLPFIGLFLLLAYDVYVIGVITALESEIEEKIHRIDNTDIELRQPIDKMQDEDILKEINIARKSIFGIGKRKGSDDSDSEENHNTEYAALSKLELGADLKEKKLDTVPEDTIIENDQDLELYLLDEQDRQEIKIKALRIGGDVDLRKYTGYETLKELDLHPWNFYEYYEVEKKKDKKGFSKYLKDMRRLKKKIIDTDSDSEESLDKDKENEGGPDNTEKEENVNISNQNASPDMRRDFNILIYYHRNMKKYSSLTILRFILEIQQRFIGAIFLLIVLVKDIPCVIIIYWWYIIYFYGTTKNAKQLQITNLFIAGITLLQYFIVLMRQNVTDENETNLLISYMNRVITTQSPDSFEKQFDFVFKVLGIVKTAKNTTLLFDSIPTVMFQITIFYYDFFLLYCAERIETFLLKVNKEIFFVRKNDYGQYEYVINFKEWKDPLGKVLNAMISISTVRLIEITVVFLLILNIYQGKLIWNFIRLIILFMIYSNVAFRTIYETEHVRGRLKFVLKFSVFYLWVRVITISLIAIDFALLNNGESTTKYLSILNIEPFEKFILVVEFFVMEYVSSIYFKDSYIEAVNAIVEKKKVRSNLVAQCITYDTNEEKLMKYIEGFSERIALEKDIATLNATIEE
jgi:hypothetical protein